MPFDGSHSPGNEITESVFLDAFDPFDLAANRASTPHLVPSRGDLRGVWGWLHSLFPAGVVERLWFTATGCTDPDSLHDTADVRGALAALVRRLDNDLTAATVDRALCGYAYAPHEKVEHYVAAKMRVRPDWNPEWLRRKAMAGMRRVRGIVDHIARTDMAVEAVEQRRLAMDAALRKIEKGSRNLADIKAAERAARRVSVWARVIGYNDVADRLEQRQRSIMLVFTLPAEFHGGRIDGAGIQDGLDALRSDLARLRAKLGQIDSRLWLDVSYHGDRAAALKEKDRIDATETMWAARTRRVDGGWAVQRAWRDGRQVVGVYSWEPHEDGTPHLSVALRGSDAVVSALQAWIARHFQRPQVMMTVKDGSEGRTAAGYVLKHHQGKDAKSLAVQDWCAAHGIQQVGWIGLWGVATAWQTIYATSLDEIQVSRARKAKEAMLARDWGTAMSQIGAFRWEGMPRLRLAYGSRSGSCSRRVLGLYDPAVPAEGVVFVRRLVRSGAADEKSVEVGGVVQEEDEDLDDAALFEPPPDFLADVR